MKIFLFDIGNVLVDFRFERLHEIIAAHSGRAISPFSERDWEMIDHVEKGLIDDPQWVDYLNETKGLDWTVDTLVDVWSDMFSRNETGCALFRSAIDAKTRVYTLSNIARHHIDAIEKNWPGFFDGASGLFLSYQIGERKPHPHIYRHVLDELGVGGADCLFIDDLPENIEAARAAGLHAYRYVPENHTEIRAAVRRFFG